MSVVYAAGRLSYAARTSRSTWQAPFWKEVSRSCLKVLSLPQACLRKRPNWARSASQIASTRSACLQSSTSSFKASRGCNSLVPFVQAFALATSWNRLIKYSTSLDLEYYSAFNWGLGPGYFHQSLKDLRQPVCTSVHTPWVLTIHSFCEKSRQVGGGVAPATYGSPRSGMLLLTGHSSKYLPTSRGRWCWLQQHDPPGVRDDSRP